ncbi:MAG: phosphatidylinositol mannoside acyltransferase, partial [Nocardioidaceae bacterium]
VRDARPRRPVTAPHAETAADAVSAWAYRFGWKVACRVPQRAVDPVLDRVADHLHGRGGAGVDRLRANMSRAGGVDDAAALDTLTRQAMRSYLRYWGEVFRLPRWDADQIRANVVVEGLDRLRGAYDSGGGVVAALPHMGNWDLCGAWACLHGMPLTTVAERLRPEALYARFVAFREGLGMEVLPLTGGEPTLPVLLDRLRAGGFVCLLADRDLSRSGLRVDLLGEPASLPAGPALLARRTGATLLPITSSYAGGRMRIRIFEGVHHRPGRDGLRAMTADVADAFSTAITDAPADWHMLQKVFVRDLPPAVGAR